MVCPDLVYKLLHTGLQAPDFKFDSDQFVGAHDGVLGVEPSFLQKPSVRLLWLKIPKVLQGHKKPGSEKQLIFPQELNKHKQSYVDNPRKIYIRP